MPTIILVRHGETHFNRERRIQGHVDSPLTLKGIGQAQAYGRTIARLTGGGEGWRMVSSPLGRCLQTSAIICEALGVDYSRITTDARLKEVDTGAWAGRPKADLPADLLARTGRESWYFNAPGGETLPRMTARLQGWLDDLGADDKVIAISHGIAGKMVRGLVTGDLDTALAEDAPQDAVFIIRPGGIDRMACI